MKTNSLIYKIDKIVNGQHLFVTIRLNDECKNGHQDFSITADIYEANKPKTDKYWIGGGCCHDDILKAFPQFKQFVQLHLSDYTGCPTHCIENGFYHLTNGFNNTPIESENFKSQFCEYYRISIKQFDVLAKSKTKEQYAVNLVELGIVAQWKIQANEAIKELENLTGNEFVIDSYKNQFNITDEQMAAEKKRIESGYYSDVNEAKRAELAAKKEIELIDNEYKSKVESARLERDALKAVLSAGSAKALKNCIYYNGSKQIAFNWCNYDNLPKETIEAIKSTIELPKGVTIKD